MIALLCLGLTSNAFAQPVQQTTQTPTYIAVVLDSSGSMSTRFGDSDRMTTAKKILINVLSKVGPNTQVGVVTFEGWVYQIQPVDQAKLAEAINGVRASGGTPLGHYMKEGANALLKVREKKKFGIYRLIVVTDGESTDDAETPLSGTYGILSKGLQVEAIGVAMNAKHSLATKVSYRSADNPDELVRAVSAVVAETGGGGDHSEDYATISTLDEKLCKDALKALSEPDNAPIGMRTKVDDNGDPVRDGKGNPVYETAKATHGGGGLGWWWVPIILGGILVIGIIIAIIKNNS
jgi:uncharacterized protein YegL